MVEIQEFDRINLYQILSAYSQSTFVPVTMYDTSGNIQMEFLSQKKICTLLHEPKLKTKCRKSLLFANATSYDLGEPYIFYCPCDFVNISIPVIYDNKLLGSVIAGPLAMGNQEEAHLTHYIENSSSDSSDDVAKIALFISKMNSHSATSVHNYSILLYNAVLSSSRNWAEYENIINQHQRQLQIGNTILNILNNKSSNDYPSYFSTYEDIQTHLLLAIQTKNTGHACSLMQDLFNELLLIEAGNFESIKSKILDLYLAIAHKALDCGASADSIFNKNFDVLDSLNKAKDIDTLIDWTENIIIQFTEDIFASLYRGRSALISQAVYNINTNYMNKMTLKSLSQDLHVNESYLSKLFKQELGVTFSDLLNKIRIERSAELIKTTNMSLLQIAVIVGFEDQSYFTKKFKAIMGKTPGQYKFKSNNLSGKQR